MRILIVTDAWSPQVNGVVRTLNALIAELRAKGHDVRTINPEGRPSRPLPLYHEITLTHITVAAMREEIAAIAPDVIHIATEGPIGWSARGCRCCGCPGPATPISRWIATPRPTGRRRARG